MRGYLVRPTKANGPVPGVVVVHENRGLNPYIEDVARRVAKAGFVALAPDGLSSVGGYPGNDEAGRELQKQVDPQKLMNDFFAAIDFLLASDFRARFLNKGVMREFLAAVPVRLIEHGRLGVYGAAAMELDSVD